MGKADDLAELYGDRLLAIREHAPIGQKAGGKLLSHWSGERIGKHLAATVLARVGVPRGKRGDQGVRDWRALLELCGESIPIAPASDIKREPIAGGTRLQTSGTRIRSLAQMLDAAEVDLDAYEVERYQIKKSEMGSKAADGTPMVTPLWHISVTLKRLPMAGLVAALARVVPSVVPLVPSRAHKVCLFIPDSQHGFVWSRNFTGLTPSHDRVALDCALQLAEEMQPDVVVFLGDMLDMQPWSQKYEVPPQSRQTTQPAVNELYWQLSEFRRLCPDAEMVLLGGNHEKRLERALSGNLGEAVGLSEALRTAPLLTVPRLLRLDDLGITWGGVYGEKGSIYWLWDRVKVHHGKAVRAGGGKTSASVVSSALHSEVFGHVHKLELACRTVTGPGSQRLVQVMSPGCMCDISGNVPAFHNPPDYQQGIGLAYLEGDSVTLHPVAVVGGTLVYGGRVYHGRSREEEIAAATGYPQIAMARSGD